MVPYLIISPRVTDEQVKDPTFVTDYSAFITRWMYQKSLNWQWGQLLKLLCILRWMGFFITMNRRRVTDLRQLCLLNYSAAAIHDKEHHSGIMADYFSGPRTHKAMALSSRRWKGWMGEEGEGVYIGILRPLNPACPSPSSNQHNALNGISWEKSAIEHSVSSILYTNRPTLPIITCL